MSAAASVTVDWQETNHRALCAALASLRARLEGPNGTGSAHLSEVQEYEQQYADVARGMDGPPALDVLCRRFALSPFERSIVLLCAATELDSSFAGAFAKAQGNAQVTYPTFSLALATMREPHWSALAPDAPLRYWRLVEFAQGGSPSAPITSRPLRIDERILHYLTGISHLDERLSPIVERLDVAGDLMPSHSVLASRITNTWSATRRGASPIPVLLYGPDTQVLRAIAVKACASVVSPYVMRSDAIPLVATERSTLVRLWERESLLSSRALVLEHDASRHNEPLHDHAVTDFIERLKAPLIVTARERLSARGRDMMEIEVSRAPAQEQGAVWRVALGSAAPRLDGQLDQLAAQFALPPQDIVSIASAADSRHDGSKLLHTLWDECRVRVRLDMDDLAQRIDASPAWEDLVLPEAQKETLRDITAHVRHRTKVHDSWGFAQKSTRGLGISAVFAGASGTGKTMAAEILARELRLDLYRIDLSSVVSKYIGETEKNLRRLFDAAEKGGAILLFDEADALFGRRSEVKDSHDRYANIEVSYLLQRMECYRGLAILTTNFKAALDPAFLRRIRFIVDFPFPDVTQRAEIWTRIFPSATPTRNLDVKRLAQLNVAGGNIRNIALNSAFLAADEGSDIEMAHVLRAARSEYAKIEKTLTDAETAGWTS